MSDEILRPNGWVDDPTEVDVVMEGLISEGQDPIFSSVAKSLLVRDDNHPVFFWEAEQKILGTVLPSWDQSSIGSCVSFGWGRGAQDLLLWEVAAGEQETWPGFQIAREPIYGGSRVEVGGGRIRGDGSIGAWAAKWVSEWGVLLYKKYEINGKVFDLSDGYRVDRCFQWGKNGVPNELEPEARIHPVSSVAMVMTGEECWAAIGAGKPVSLCSNQGFTTTLVEGFCQPSGVWAHCMVIRGRFIHPKHGKCFVIQNSWGNYLRGNNKIEVVGRDEKVTLPEGCFATTLGVVSRMVAQRDSFSMAGLSGWTRIRLNWTS